MNNSQVKELKALSLTDMERIQEALEDKARATKKFLNDHVEPNKDGYPSLYSSYQRLLREETDLLHRFADCLIQMY